MGGEGRQVKVPDRDERRTTTKKNTRCSSSISSSPNTIDFAAAVRHVQRRVAYDLKQHVKQDQQWNIPDRHVQPERCVATVRRGIGSTWRTSRHVGLEAFTKALSAALPARRPSQPIPAHVRTEHRRARTPVPVPAGRWKQREGQHCLSVGRRALSVGRRALTRWQRPGDHDQHIHGPLSRAHGVSALLTPRPCTPFHICVSLRCCEFFSRLCIAVCCQLQSSEFENSVSRDLPSLLPSSAPSPRTSASTDARTHSSPMPVE